MSDTTIKVLLLAPQNAIGGIATWAKILLKYTDSSQINYQVIDTTKRYDVLGKKLRFRGAFLGLIDSIKRFSKTIKALFSFKPDIIHINTSPSIGLFVRDIPLLLLLRLLNQKTIIHLHGGKADGFLGNNPIRKYITKLGLKSSSAVFVITRDIEKLIKSFVSDSKVIYVPNMIDDDFVNKIEPKLNFTSKENKIKLINVAWQAPEKGSLDLVEAVKYIKNNIDFQLIGTVAEENEKLIDQKRVELNIQDKIRLTGPKIGEELSKAYKEADILVFPSHFEGFPMVILEAMAYGLPIISSRAGNISEMLNFDSCESAGIILKSLNPIDPKEIAEKIDYLIENTNIRKDLSHKAYSRVRKKYSATQIVPQIGQIYKSIIQDNKITTSFN